MKDPAWNNTLLLEERLNNGTYGTTYKKGDEVYINLSNVATKFTIVGINTDIDNNNAPIPLTLVLRDIYIAAELIECPQVLHQHIDQAS